MRLTRGGRVKEIVFPGLSGGPPSGAVAGYLKANPECRSVLVEKTDRLLRNFKDYVILDGIDVELHFVKDNCVVSETSRASEKFMHGIKVLMAKNYIDNLGEEASKGLREKAEQGHWPSAAPLGYRNNRETHRIEIDPERAPLFRRLFEMYAAGDVSLKELTVRARGLGLTHPRSGRPLTKSEIHRVLHNPIYAGAFLWKGRTYSGVHEPIITQDLFEKTKAAFNSGIRPTFGKGGFAYAGLLTCAGCGCAITAERKKGRYIYYHCTGHRGRCGGRYIREETLRAMFAEVVARVALTAEQGEILALALTESHRDQEREHRRAVLMLQQNYQRVQQTLDRAYDDRLAGALSEDAWLRRSTEWEAELRRLKGEAARLERAERNYMETGSRIIELAKTAKTLFIQQEPPEQRRLLETLLSNCSLSGGSLCPTYRKPFDLLVKGNESGDWLGRRDSFPFPASRRRVGM